MKRKLAGSGDDNLLHTLLEWARESEPSLLLLEEDLPSARGASRLSLEDLKKEVSCSALCRTKYILLVLV